MVDCSIINQNTVWVKFAKVFLFLSCDRRDIWYLTYYNGDRTRNYWDYKRTLHWLSGRFFVYELICCGFQSRCNHLTILWFKEKQKLKRMTGKKTKVATSRQITFNYCVPRISWYSFDRLHKDQRLSQLVLLWTWDLWNSITSTLTTRTLLPKYVYTTVVSSFLNFIWQDNMGLLREFIARVLTWNIFGVIPLKLVRFLQHNPGKIPPMILKIFVFSVLTSKETKTISEKCQKVKSLSKITSIVLYYSLL